MFIEIYSLTDTHDVKRQKCKDFLLNHPDELFDNDTLTLNIIRHESGRVYATCCEGEQCCSLDWESIDEFLDDYLLYFKQTLF